MPDLNTEDQATNSQKRGITGRQPSIIPIIATLQTDETHSVAQMPSLWETLAQVTSNVTGMATSQVEKAIAETTRGVNEALDGATLQADKLIAETTVVMGEAVGTSTSQVAQVFVETATGVGETLNSVSTQAETAIAQTANTVSIMIETAAANTEEIYSKIQEIGGGFTGAIAGEAFGTAVGSVAGTALLGPAGTLLGSQLGGFIGFTIGAQLGKETVTQLNQITKVQTSGKFDSFEERLKQSLHRRGGEKVGDTVGALIGGTVGGVVLGSPGVLIGSSIGGAFGGQIGEDVVHTLNHPGQLGTIQEAQKPGESVTTWFGHSTSKFVAETVTTTMGGIVGGMVLGPEGRQLGGDFGTFVGKQLDWTLDPALASGIKPLKTSSPPSHNSGLPWLTPISRYTNKELFKPLQQILAE